jgi:hypothetical protein
LVLKAVALTLVRTDPGAKMHIIVCIEDCNGTLSSVYS